MAALSNPFLTIKLISGTSNADIVANVNVSFDQFEQFLISSGGLNVYIKCKLVGADSWFNGGDDDLYIFPNQLTQSSGIFTFNATLPRSIIDEDSVGSDEVYAHFTLASAHQVFPLLVEVNSPEISGDF